MIEKLGVTYIFKEKPSRLGILRREYQVVRDTYVSRHICVATQNPTEPVCKYFACCAATCEQEDREGRALVRGEIAYY